MLLGLNLYHDKSALITIMVWMKYTYWSPRYYI